jgi:hypothetical protein
MTLHLPYACEQRHYRPHPFAEVLDGPSVLSVDYEYGVSPAQQSFPTLLRVTIRQLVSIMRPCRSIGQVTMRHCPSMHFAMLLESSLSLGMTLFLAGPLLRVTKSAAVIALAVYAAWF